ncbi:acetyl-CoA carboxylase biotin carboxyl carrier protein [soil metagenome]
MVAAVADRAPVMSEDEALELLDDLVRLARGSRATRIEVETDDLRLAVAVDPSSTPPGSASGSAAAVEPLTGRAQRVTATTVGIFGAAREWNTGDAVERGVVLGSIQSLGHMAEITAPADGEIAEVLVAGGAPVEYGQPLFAIAPRPTGPPQDRRPRG